jgi:hypothetical protein
MGSLGCVFQVWLLYFPKSPPAPRAPTRDDSRTVRWPSELEEKGVVGRELGMQAHDQVRWQGSSWMADLTDNQAHQSELEGFP